MFPSFEEHFETFFTGYSLKAGSFKDCRCPEFLNCSCFMSHKEGRNLFIHGWERERSRLQAEHDDDWMMRMELSNAKSEHFRVAPGTFEGCKCPTEDCFCYEEKKPELYKMLQDSWVKTVEPALLEEQKQFRELKRARHSSFCSKAL